MNERQSDFEWLQEFARGGSQEAFRELVRRHIDLVFATALRKAEDAGAAEEIAQNVFGTLARKAWQFAPDDSLPAWLYKTTLLESSQWLRGELRRRRREQTAVELGTTMKTPSDQSAFQALVPLLDDALLSLREKDRTVLLLRFYEKQSLREVGSAMGVSEDTAQKRVSGALERLSQFFQRRGYQTATVGAAMAALQHTSAAVPTVTVNAITSVVMQTAPPALTGLSAVAARLATLTKAQTAAVCLVLVAGPVLWQLDQQFRAATALASTRQQITKTQTEYDQLRMEVDQQRDKSTRLASALEDKMTSAAQQADIARQFEDWKKKIRGELLAGDYRWPEDSPFVRIHKTVVPQLSVQHAITQPGVVRQEASELLGLSPGERQQVEEALQKYFSEMNDMMATNLIVTNQTDFAYVPKDALDTRVYGLSGLGEGVTQDADVLKASLQAVLSGDRWPMVEEELKYPGTDTLRRVLSLDAASDRRELAVWVSEQNGELLAGYNWRETSSSFSSSGMTLKSFLPDAQFPDGKTVDDFVDFRDLPKAITGPAMDWLRQQAVNRLGQKGGL